MRNPCAGVRQSKPRSNAFLACGSVRRGDYQTLRARFGESERPVIRRRLPPLSCRRPFQPLDRPVGQPDGKRYASYSDSLSFPVGAAPLHASWLSFPVGAAPLLASWLSVPACPREGGDRRSGLLASCSHSNSQLRLLGPCRQRSSVTAQHGLPGADGSKGCGALGAAAMRQRVSAGPKPSARKPGTKRQGVR